MWETRLILLVAVNSGIFNNEMRTNILLRKTKSRRGGKHV